MPTMKQIIFTSMLVFALLSTVAGQDNTAVPKSSLTITAAAAGERVRITAPSTVVQLHVEVYGLNGEKIFDQEIRGGNVFDWHLHDGQGQRPAPGNYICVVTAKSISGKLTRKLGTVTVAENSVSIQAADSQPLTAPQMQAIGPIEENSSLTILSDSENQTTTVIANDGNEGKMIRGRGALSFRLGDFFNGKDEEQMRLTEQDDLGIGTSEPKARLDVAGTVRAERFLVAKSNKQTNTGNNAQANESSPASDSSGGVQPLVAGTGTQNQLAKWTDNSGTLGNSVVTETGNNVGLGTTTPGAPLESFKSAGANAAGGGLIVSRYNDGGGTFRGGAIYSRFISAASDDALVFGVTSTGTKNPYTDFDQARMVILANGNVGIGTINPRFKLDVESIDGDEGTASLYGENSGGAGVVGYSHFSLGVVGYSDTDIGVFGESPIGIGVRGRSNTGDAVWGKSTDGIG